MNPKMLYINITIMDNLENNDHLCIFLNYLIHVFVFESVKPMFIIKHTFFALGSSNCVEKRLLHSNR